MQADFYLTDDATLATALAFGPTAAGATSAAQVLHLWFNKGTPGSSITNLRIQAVDPATDLDHGVDWLDQTWIEARINGGSNPGNDVTFQSYTSDWYRIGNGVVLPVQYALPGNCAYFVEVRLHPPLVSGASSETVNFKLAPRYNESSLSLPGALSDLGCGIVTGVGDPTAIEWIVAPTVLATATPDDVVHVSGARFYLNYGVPFTTTAQDDLTLNQNDGASAALTTGHSYIALISQPPGIEEAAVVTKGLLAVTGTATVPALPAGDLLIAVCHVAYHASASVINQSDIVAYATSGRGLPSIGTGLNVTIAALRAIMPGARIVNRSARTVAVPASLTSYLWLSSADQVTVNQSTTPPFVGAVLLCSVVTDGSSVTSLTDLRTYFQVGGWGLNLVDLADNAAALAAGLLPGQFYRTTDAVKVVH